jgi:hypothetical protein
LELGRPQNPKFWIVQNKILAIRPYAACHRSIPKLRPLVGEVGALGTGAVGFGVVACSINWAAGRAASMACAFTFAGRLSTVGDAFRLWMKSRSPIAFLSMGILSLSDGVTKVKRCQTLGIPIANRTERTLPPLPVVCLQ